MSEEIVWVCGRRPAESPLAWIIHDVVATEEEAKAFLGQVRRDRNLESQPSSRRTEDGERSWRLKGEDGSVWSAERFAVRGPGSED